MKSKKTIGNALRLIIYIPIVILIGLFMTVGIFQIGEEFFINNIHNISVETGNNIGIEDSYINSLDKLKTDFQEEEPPFELLFGFILVIVFAISIYIAIVSDKLPHLSFLGSAVLGMMILLLIITFVDQFASWYLNEFFYRVFDRVDNILLDWYFDNLSLASSIWFALILFFNQIDIERIGQRLSGRNKGGIIEE